MSFTHRAWIFSLELQGDVRKPSTGLCCLYQSGARSPFGDTATKSRRPTLAND
jgi:hypothetical protein